MWEEAYRTACADRGLEPREDVCTSGASGEVVVRGNAPHNSTRRLTDRDVEVIVAALRSCHAVSSLCFPFNAIGEEGGVLLGKALVQHSDALITLDLQSNELGAAAGAAVAQGVEKSDAIRNLILASNPLTGKCGPAFGVALRHNSSLTVLDLFNTDMDVQALVHVCDALQDNRGLVSLILGRPLLHSPDDVASVVTHLSTSLAVNQTLEELQLSYFGMRDSDLHFLVVALCTSAVTTLNLRGNQLSEDAGQLLSRLLDRRHDFRSLDVSCNRLCDSGAQHLAKGVALHPKLESLSVASCKMHEVGLVDLTVALGSCAALRRLSLWGNEVTPAVAMALSRAFGDLRELDRVDVGIEQRDGQWFAYHAT